MKKVFNVIFILAVSAFAFSACQKEQIINDETQEGKLVTVTFTAEKAGFDTKTAAVEGASEVSFVWTDEDIANMRLFEVLSDGIAAVSSPIITKVSDTKLTISAQVASGEHTFYAILSNEYTGSGSDYSTRKPRIKASQSPIGTSNFDPNADILKSDNLTVNVAEDGQSEDMLMLFRRQVVVNKMILKNLVAGEKVSKVVISSPNDLTGYLDGSEMKGQKKVIELEYTDVAVPEGGLFPVYFVTMPGTGHSLTVDVTTNLNTYRKSFAEGKSVDFILGQFTTFNLALPEGVAKTSLSLPFVDDMSWADNGSEDGTVALNSVDLIKTNDSGQKLYSEVVNCYKGAGGLKLGTSNNRGSITSSEINLSSPFTIVVSAKRFGSDVSKLQVSVDGTVVGQTAELYQDFVEYVFDLDKATDASTVVFSITGKRGYINSISILPDSYTAKPVVIVSGDIARSVGSASSDGQIEYTIANPSSDLSLTATTDADWISISSTADGIVSYSISANTGAARSGSITLAYSGAESKIVTINQSEYVDPSSATEYQFTITTSDFNSTSYAANNNEKTSIAKATDGSGKTIEVKWTSYQVMLSQDVMQWQKNNGLIYNSTDLGTITDVNVTSSAGTFTRFIGTTSQPETNAEGGFFQVKVGSATGKTSKITVTFKK